MIASSMPLDRGRSGFEQRFKVTIEVLEKFVHVDHIGGGHRFRLDILGFFGEDFRRLQFLEPAHRLFAQSSQGMLCFFGIAIVEDSRHKIARVAIGAFDEHRPHFAFPRNDGDIVGVKLVMADDTAFETVEHDTLDSDF
jgi:hypothetical protein